MFSSLQNEILDSNSNIYSQIYVELCAKKGGVLGKTLNSYLLSNHNFVPSPYLHHSGKIKSEIFP